MQDEINNLRILVEVILAKIKREAEGGTYKTVSELLWHVPTNILQSYVKDK